MLQTDDGVLASVLGCLMVLKEFWRMLNDIRALAQGQYHVQAHGLQLGAVR